jgi:class 3 adenylate cyclase
MRGEMLRSGLEGPLRGRLGPPRWAWHRDCARLRHARHDWLEGRFDYAAVGTVSNVASRLCDEAKPGQILISPRVLMKVENAVNVELVGEFELKGIRRPLAAYNVLSAATS